MIAVAAAALAGALALAVVGKALDPAGWRALASRAGGTPGHGVALAVAVPMVELATAGLLIVHPPAGLGLAAAVFAALAVGAQRLRASSEGAPCGCFGPVLETRIGSGLVRRNLVLAALAAVLAPVAAATGTRSGATTVAAGAALAAVTLLAARVIAARPPSGAQPPGPPAPAGDDDVAASRRVVLGTAVAASALVVLEAVRPGVGAARALGLGVTRETVRRPSAGTRLVYDRNVKNRVNDTCSVFGDRLVTGGGVLDWDGKSQGNGVGGYTWAEGLEDGQTPKAGACKVRERQQRIWRGYCSCPTYVEYTDETKCKVACQSTLKCFGVQCQTLEERWCVDLLYDVCLEIPLIVISTLEWTPQRGASRGCRRMAAAYNRGLKRHEQRHAADIKRVLQEVNNDFKNLSARGCGPTLAAARADANIAVDNSIQRARDQLKQRDAAASAAFHGEPAGANGLVDCRQC